LVILAAVMEPVDMRVSEARVRKDVGVRLTPAALPRNDEMHSRVTIAKALRLRDEVDVARLDEFVGPKR